MAMSKEHVDQLLSQPNIAVVAVTAPDGHPHAVPTWYEYRDGEVVFHTAASAFKYRCLQHDNRVALCVDTRVAPCKAVIVKGRASMIETMDDERLERMSIAYLGEKAGRAYAKTLKGQKVVVVRFKPSRTISWDYTGELPT
jgi:PPOX class probable F420-dependent enzyme